MAKLGILSVKPEFAQRIFDRTKTIELRRSLMGIKEGDVLLIYASAPEQFIIGWLRVAKVEISSVQRMWKRHQNELGIEQDEYLEYFGELPRAIGIHVGETHKIKPHISLSEVQRLVRSFVPPQGILWVKSQIGRYRRLVKRLSKDLPDDVFAQLPLFKESSASRTTAKSEELK